MKVITKLRGAFALYITLLGVLLVYHVSTLRHVVATGHALTELSSRIRATAVAQVARVAQLGENAAKYCVTRDRGYLEKFDHLTAAYDAELHHVQSLPLSAPERRAVARLAHSWRALGPLPQRLAAFAQLPSRNATRDSLAALQQSLATLQQQTRLVGNASQAVMERQLAHSARAASAAERLSWIAAVGIFLSSILISVLIARSISEPLHRLAEGTRQVAQGDFDYRLDGSRDDEFAQVARSFNTMTERLGALDRMKRDFVSNVSHDLKTPLTSMQETINALLDEVSGPLTPTQRTLLTLNRQNGERLSAMLAKLLDLSRLEAGTALELRTVDGAQLLRHAVAQADGARRDRDVCIEIALPASPLPLRCDADRMRQLLDNLLENAVKFSPRDSVIRIAAAVVDDRPASVPPARWAAYSHRESRHALWITMSDQGPGVPDGQKERIFERFYQTDAGRAAPRRGVGLGLTICRETVEAHGGTIWVADNREGGSIFNILLPTALDAPAALAAAGSPRGRWEAT